MLSNFLIIRGPADYNHQIAFLQGLPFVVFLEISFIGLPILFHAGYGFYVIVTGKRNLLGYPYPENWLYTLQRWTGVVTFIYVIQHVWQTRISNALYGTEVSYARMAELVRQPLNFWIYLIGLTAVMFHFANGIWGFFISWGVTSNSMSRRISGWFSAAVGLTLYGVGVAALFCLVK
jgi:succinate dehydrogenase / fumarate reductase cytochrome b subunit